LQAPNKREGARERNAAHDQETPPAELVDEENGGEGTEGVQQRAAAGEEERVWNAEARLREVLGEKVQDGVDTIELGEHARGEPDERAARVVPEERAPWCGSTGPVPRPLLHL
jgi:hypothetical protein